MATGTFEAGGKKFNWNCCNSVMLKWVGQGNLKNMAALLPLIERGQTLPYPECYSLVTLAIEKAKQETENGKLVRYSKSIIDDMFDEIEPIPLAEIVNLAAEMITKMFGIEEKKTEKQEPEKKEVAT